MDPRASTEAPPVGGQALIEGVMMRRGDRWAAAVRLPDGRIETRTADVSHRFDAARRWPIARGVVALVESMQLGVSALTWSARQREGDESSGYSGAGVALSVVAGVVLAVGAFGLLPAAVAHLAGPEGAFGFSLVESLVRLGLVVAYLWLLGRSAEVRRVFGYHGAEHKTVNAFEHGADLTVPVVQGFSRRHARCGTTFVLLVVVVATVVHVALGRPSLPVLLASRVVGLPLVAGLAYELIRHAARHLDRAWARAVMAPGYWLQGLTTGEPDDDQVEVAIASLVATLSPLDGSAAPAVAATGAQR